MHPNSDPISSKPVTPHGDLPVVRNLQDYIIIQHSTHTNIYVTIKSLCSELTSRMAIKSCRILPTTDSRIAQWVITIRTLQTLCTDISHEHLEPFDVVYINDSGTPLPAIATTWYENGDILHYVRRNPAVEKLKLIYQVVCVMSYLHGKGIIHGNFYPGNILITNQRTARVTDIGLDTLIVQHMYSDFTPVTATWMYTAPEQLELGTRTMETDVYALGSTIYTIYASHPPYQPTTVSNVARGIREIITTGHQQVFESLQPVGMSDIIWVTVQRCWNYDARRRPSMAEIEMIVENILKGQA